MEQELSGSSSLKVSSQFGGAQEFDEAEHEAITQSLGSDDDADGFSGDAVGYGELVKNPLNHNVDDQYLAFTLGSEHYAVAVSSVKEIRGWDKPTSIPRSEEWVKGVISLHGIIVPIVDLRQQFSLGDAAYDSKTVVVFLSSVDQELSRVVGFVVDSIAETFNARGSQIKKPAFLAGTVSRDYIRGLANIDGTVITIFDLPRLMDLDQEKSK